MSKNNPEITIVCGPTAVGKTAFAIDLAEQVGGEIISADSRQIFREMDIATAKPTQDELLKVPHFLIDVLNPDESFSVGLFQQMALEKVENILAREKKPFLVGGTGLYISSVLDGYTFHGVLPDEQLRGALSLLSLDELVDQLSKADSEGLSLVDCKNKQRVIRALEIIHTTKQPLTEVLRSSNAQPYEFSIILLELPRDVLYRRIDLRIDVMLKRGVLDEVEYLGKRYGWGISSMLTLGYKQLGLYVRGEISLEDAVALFKRDSRRYAKRQLTWFENKVAKHHVVRRVVSNF
ncbi:MAG: tRNA (adenosine(37)-N6)-dimethylallyltransferase MiaA [bacterium]